jgi:hypothetical protein
MKFLSEFLWENWILYSYVNESTCTLFFSTAHLVFTGHIIMPNPRAAAVKFDQHEMKMKKN